MDSKHIHVIVELDGESGDWEIGFVMSEYWVWNLAAVRLSWRRDN